MHVCLSACKKGAFCCAQVTLLNKVKPDEFYNLAAQSHVHTSFELPVYTAHVDGIGTLNCLEAIRQAGLAGKTKFYQVNTEYSSKCASTYLRVWSQGCPTWRSPTREARQKGICGERDGRACGCWLLTGSLIADIWRQASTSELYGKIQEPRQSETTPFYPRSPYACAKLMAYWCVVNYREAYNMFAVNGWVIFALGPCPVLDDRESPGLHPTIDSRWGIGAPCRLRCS